VGRRILRHSEVFALSSPPRPDLHTVRRGLAVLGQAIRTEPRPFLVSLVGATLYAATTVAAALVFGRVTDRVILPAFRDGRLTRGALVVAVTAIVGTAVAKALGIVARRVGASAMQFRLQARFRRDLTAAYLRLPVSWHRRHPTGELLSITNSDVEAAFAPIAPLPFSCAVLLLLVLAGVVLAVTDPFLAMIGAAIAPALAVLNGRYNAKSAGPAARAQELRGRVSSVAHESIDGASVVKTLGREQAETDRFRAEADRLRDELVHLGRLRASFDPLSEALPTTATLLVLLVGALRVQAGELTVGELVRVAYLFTLLSFPVRMIGYLLSEFPRSVVGWERMHGVLGADGATEYGSERLHGGGPAGVELAKVRFRYPDTTTDVLAEIDVAIEQARTVALVGPTGAGKSTIASLLVRLGDPDGGQVRLDGVDVRQLAFGSVPATAALVFQHTFLFDDTVRGNVTLGEDFSDAEVRAACRLAQADAFIQDLPAGYDTLVGERGATLSGGQRQRIALARALVRRPRLLVLDDATSSVDPSVEAAILTGLRDAALPSTVVVVAYRRATVALADEVILIDRGRVRARGTHEELLRVVPEYARLITAADTPAEGPAAVPAR